MAYGLSNISKMFPKLIIISKLIEKKELKLLHGNKQYFIVYIDDIVSVMIVTNKKGVDSQSYYVGHDDNRTYEEFFRQVEAIINSNIKFKFGKYFNDNLIDYSLIDKKLLIRDIGWKSTSSFEKIYNMYFKVDSR